MAQTCGWRIMQSTTPQPPAQQATQLERAASVALMNGHDVDYLAPHHNRQCLCEALNSPKSLNGE